MTRDSDIMDLCLQTSDISFSRQLHSSGLDERWVIRREIPTGEIVKSRTGVDDQRSCYIEDRAEEKRAKIETNITVKDGFITDIECFVDGTKELGMGLKNSLVKYFSPTFWIPEKEYQTKRKEALRDLSSPGVHLIDDTTTEGLFGSKSNGTARRVMVIIPHQDDESGIGGALSRIVKQVGGENVAILYITNGNGVVSDDNPNALAAERRAFGLLSQKLGKVSCNMLGISDKNVRFLPADEIEWYNGFITPNIEKADPAEYNVPADFKKVYDLHLVAYRTANWIYSNMMEFSPDIIIIPDRLYTVGMHDWANILSKLALQQYKGDEKRDIDLFVFPQQNQVGENGKALFYRYPSEIEAKKPTLRFELNGQERKIKRDMGLLYFLGNNLKLFTGYLLQMGWGYFHFAKNDNMRYEPSLEVEIPCPPIEEQGLSFDGPHYGVEHSCEDNYTNVLKKLEPLIKERPFTLKAITPFDPFLDDPL